MLRKLSSASKPIISNTWYKLNEVGQYTLEWFLKTLKDVIQPAYIWRKFDKNNVCVLVCTLVAFVRLLILVEVLAFFNLKKMTFCRSGNLIPEYDSILK